MKPLEKLVILVVCRLVASFPAHVYSQTTANFSFARTLKYVVGIVSITHLTFTGVIDVRDVAFMSDKMLYPATPDLSGTTIMKY